MAHGAAYVLRTGPMVGTEGIAHVFMDPFAKQNLLVAYGNDRQSRRPSMLVCLGGDEWMHDNCVAVRRAQDGQLNIIPIEDAISQWPQ